MAELIRGSDLFGADRYKYDFGTCTYANGWAQVDTTQDAPYYGTWTNPYELLIFNYCEGDTCLTKCSDVDDYRKEIRKTAAWNREHGYWLGIDAGLGTDMKQRFIDLSLHDLLH